MKTKEDLKQLYDAELQPQLNEMEGLRKFIKRIWRGAKVAGGFAVIFYLSKGDSNVLLALTVVFAVIAIGLGIWGLIKYMPYKSAFKKEVVAKIVNLINPDYNYDATRHISLTDFDNSKLFNHQADRCKGDDFVSGVIEKTDFQFSELMAEYKTESTKDGKRETEWHTIFKGLFFHADFNKSLTASTFVLPDSAEKLLGKFGQKFQKSISKGKLVKLENPEFEKEFVVYSSSQQEARYILTPTMMEAMVNMKRQLKYKMHFSFVKDRVYCAIDFKKPLFEPNIRKGVKFSDVEEMYHLFNLIEIMIHEMNLNTRIWTKA